jgi:hypothetical protein
MKFIKFKQLKFTRKEEFSDSYRETILESFIPGVNSGAYNKTIHIKMTVIEYKPYFFWLKKQKSIGYITLNSYEFKEFTEEINKINSLSNT